MRSRRAHREVLLGLIDQIYAAAEDPQLWERFLLSLTESVNDDQRLVAAVVPHVQRALQIHQHISDARHEHAAAIDALDAVPCAVFLATADAKVVLANWRGRAMLAANDGLSTDRSRLSTANPRETKQLREMCAMVAATRSSVPRHPGGMMALTGRASGRPALQVIVAPAPSPNPQAERVPDVTAIVFVSDPAEERGVSEALLQQAYGLTPAEAHVAARIAAGRTLNEIAAERGSAVETVRRQNKQILAKTGARHRSDLVRMLSTAVPVMAGSGGKPRVVTGPSASTRQLSSTGCRPRE